MMKLYLNVGCGNDIKKRNEKKMWYNLDFKEGKGIDIIHNLNIFPYPFKESTFDGIYCRQVLQLLRDPENVLNEFWRIAKPNGEIELYTAYYHNKGAFNDIKTIHWFNENSFKFFVEHPAESKQEKRFEIIHLYIEPTWFLKWLPTWILKNMDLFMCGVFQDIHIKLRVIK